MLLYMVIYYSDVFDCDVVEKCFLKMFEFVEFFGVILNDIRYEIKGKDLVIIKYVIEEVLQIEIKWYKDEYERFVKYVLDLYESNLVIIDMLYVFNFLFCCYKIFFNIFSEGILYSKFDMIYILIK